MIKLKIFIYVETKLFPTHQLLINALCYTAVCNPPCINGACVAADTCSCSVGYTGLQCDTAIVTECDVDPCQNGGNCSNLAGSIICSCPMGFGGSSCATVIGIYSTYI